MDTFHNYFSFNTVKCKDAKARTAHLNQLKNVYQRSSNSHDIIFIISDTSVKNNIVTSVSYIQRKHNIIRKTIYHAMNISSTKAKLFIIRCGISQATQIQEVKQIVIITDAILVVKKNFNTSHYLYQLHSITISNDLRKFFNKNPNNLITFWDCLSDNP